MVTCDVFVFGLTRFGGADEKTGVDVGTGSENMVDVCKACSGVVFIIEFGVVVRFCAEN